MDGVGFIFLGNHCVFLSADRGDWKSAGLVSVELMFQIDNV